MLFSYFSLGFSYISYCSPILFLFIPVFSPVFPIFLLLDLPALPAPAALCYFSISLRVFLHFLYFSYFILIFLLFFSPIFPLFYSYFSDFLLLDLPALPAPAALCYFPIFLGFFPTFPIFLLFFSYFLPISYKLLSPVHFSGECSWVPLKMLAQASTLANFIITGSSSNWWGLGCPSHCSGSLSVLALAFLSGSLSGVIFTLFLFRATLLTPSARQAVESPEVVPARPRSLRLRPYLHE